MLEHYRRLLSLRRAHPALHRGSMELLDSPEGVVRWRRSWGDETVEIAVNFTDRTIGDAIVTGTTIGGTHPEWITSGSERPMGGTLARTRPASWLPGERPASHAPSR